MVAPVSARIIIALLAAALVKVLAFDLDRLSATNRSYSLLMVGALALLAGIVYAHGGDRLFPARLEPTQLHLVTVCCVLASVGFVVPAIVELLDGRTWVVEREPGGLLLAAAIYGAFSALVFREAEQRDLSTLLWTIGLVLAAVGSAMLLAGNWLTLAWTVVVVLLAWLASRTGEERLTLAAFAYLSIAALYTLAVAAPLSDLFVVDAHPAAGVPSVLLVGLALVGLALLAPPFSQRPLVYWVAGGTFLYASSLAILGFFQWFAEDEGRSVASAFDRGHTGVSALWGVMAFVLLVVGLSRRWRALRLAGLALFAATLAKIFLYDLSSLSSMARALSFLAVGMVLLLAAFVYQRVSERLEGVPRPFGEAR
jgi:hypothetical protein